MLVMPSTGRNFQSMADKIAEDFFSNGTPLSEGIVAAAKEAELVPEEVRRLTEKTNTAAMLQLLGMEGRSKDVFPLASVDEVLSLTHPEGQEEAEAESESEEAVTPYPEKTAALSDTVRKARQDAFDKAFQAHGMRKTAFTRDSRSKEALSDYLALKDHRARLELQKTAAERTMQERMCKLASRYRTMRCPDFQQDMADALAVIGDRCLPVVQALAETIPNVSAPLEKSAGIVDDRASWFSDVRAVCDARDDYVMAERTLKRVDRAMVTAFREAQA